MSRLIFLLLVCFHCLGIHAIDFEKFLRVELKNGTYNDYIISDRPEVSFEGKIVTFSCKTISTSYDRDNLKNFYFLDNKETEIININAGNTRFRYFFEEGVIIIEGITEHEDIKVYSINGLQCQVEILYSLNKAKIVLSQLLSDYYIINIGNKQSIKIIKK